MCIDGTNTSSDYLIEFRSSEIHFVPETLHLTLLCRADLTEIVVDLFGASFEPLFYELFLELIDSSIQSLVDIISEICSHVALIGENRAHKKGGT